MKYSPAEKAEWKGRMQALAKQVRALPKDKQEELAYKIGTITCEGHRLSPFNALFLHFLNGQGQPLAQVGGFRQWQKVGRKVIKGEKCAGYIYVPLTKKTNDVESDTDEKIHFRLVPVFDVNQTETI